MFIKTVILTVFFMLAVGFNSSPVAAASMENHHKDSQPEILITRLNISLSDRLSNKPLHFCPIHGRIMKGAFCKMKFSSFNDPDSASKDKEECFISIDNGGLPFGTDSVLPQLDHKFAESNLSDMALTTPCYIFTCSEFKDYSQSYINPPDKPPKLFS